MIFKLKFSDGVSSFCIPEEHLKRHPATMLSALANWAGGADAAEPRVIEAVSAAQMSWCDKMGEQVAAWYAGDGGTLVSGVEFGDWLVIADWLSLSLDTKPLMPVGQPGDYARGLRADIFLKRRANLTKAVAFMKDAMKSQTAPKVRFGFLKNDDNLDLINHGQDEPIVRVGVGGGRYEDDAASAQMSPAYGTPADASDWASEDGLREECIRLLEVDGLSSDWSLDKYNVNHRRAYRYILTVHVPPAAPAAKRLRTASKPVWDWTGHGAAGTP